MCLSVCLYLCSPLSICKSSPFPGSAFQHRHPRFLSYYLSFLEKQFLGSSSKIPQEGLWWTLFSPFSLTKGKKWFGCSHEDSLVYACALSHSVVSDSLWPHGRSLPDFSWGFSRQEYWSGLPCPPPGDLPNPGIEPRSPTLQADSLLSEPPGKPKISSLKFPNFKEQSHGASLGDHEEKEDKDQIVEALSTAWILDYPVFNKSVISRRIICLSQRYIRLIQAKGDLSQGNKFNG